MNEGCVNEISQRIFFDKIFVNFMLLHGHLLDNPGLMIGKTGIVVSLFEISRIDKRSIVEDTAFDLLKEVLAWDLNDYSFKKGKAGIACGLYYITKNNFIDCNYNELYGLELQNILSYIKKLDVKKVCVEECIGYIAFLLYLKKEISIDDFEKISSILFPILVEYYQFMPANPIEVSDFYTSATMIFSIYNLLDEDRYLLKNIIDSIISIYEYLDANGSVCNNLNFGYEFYRYSKECLNDKLIQNSHALLNLILKNIFIAALTLEEAIELYYILNKIYKEKEWVSFKQLFIGINSLFSYDNIFNKQSLINRTKLSSLVSLEHGIPKLVLMECVLSKEEKIENKIFKLFV